MNDRVEELRKVLLDRTRVPEPCAVLLSNGVDSNTLLAAALRNNRKPIVISFRVAHRISTDWSAARRTADRLGLTFVDVEVSDDVDEIAADVRWAIGLGLRKKADIECAVPVGHAINTASALGIKTLLTGAAADGHYALSRKAVVAAHDGRLDDPDWLDAFRSAYFARQDPAQATTMRRYAATQGVDLQAPYIDERILEILRGATWRELNKPRQKTPARLAFPEIETWGVGRQHVNLQLGDSGIARNFERLLASTYNTRGSRSVVGIYNEFARTR